MNKIARVEDRTQMICDSILGDAAEKSRKIMEAADILRDQEIHRQEEQIIDRMYETMRQELDEMKHKRIHSIAQHGLARRRELLSRREELATMVFANVRSRIAAFTGSPEYAGHLAGTLTRCVSELGTGGLVLFLRKSDEVHATRLLPLLGENSQVKTDPVIKLGGFILYAPAKGQLADETLDAKLQENQQWFYETCGMTID